MPGRGRGSPAEGREIVGAAGGTAAALGALAPGPGGRITQARLEAPPALLEAGDEVMQQRVHPGCRHVGVLRQVERSVEAGERLIIRGDQLPADLAGRE